MKFKWTDGGLDSQWTELTVTELNRWVEAFSHSSYPYLTFFFPDFHIIYDRMGPNAAVISEQDFRWKYA